MGRADDFAARGVLPRGREGRRPAVAAAGVGDPRRHRPPEAPAGRRPADHPRMGGGLRHGRQGAPPRPRAPRRRRLGAPRARRRVRGGAPRRGRRRERPRAALRPTDGLQLLLRGAHVRSRRPAHGQGIQAVRRECLGAQRGAGVRPLRGAPQGTVGPRRPDRRRGGGLPPRRRVRPSLPAAGQRQGAACGPPGGDVRRERRNAFRRGLSA